MNGTSAMVDLPEVERVGSRLFLLERPGRRTGALRISWRPPEPSPFWSERGSLAVPVWSAFHTPSHRGRSLLDDLEAHGVSLEINEGEFSCTVDLSGDAEDLAACATQVLSNLTTGRTSADSIAAAERWFVQRRRTFRTHPYGVAETARWEGHVSAPARLTHDRVPGRPALDLPAPSSVVVVGSHDLATAWAIAGPEADAAVPIPTMSRPEPTTVLAGQRRGQSFIAYGAVELLTEAEMFDLELALEVLAGWSGSVLNQLFRQSLAWSYGVRQDLRSWPVGDRRLVNWSAFLQAAPELTEPIVAQIGEQTRRQLIDCPDDDTVRRTARRILHRELLWEDTVTGVLQRQADDARNPLSRRRRRHLTGAKQANLVRGLARMAGSGTFIVISGQPDRMAKG